MSQNQFMASRANPIRTRAWFHRLGLALLSSAALVFGGLAVGVLAPGIPVIGLGGRWHVLGLGAWWLLAAMSVALLLAIAAAGARTVSVHRGLAAMAALAIGASAVFGAAIGAAGSAAVAQGAQVASLMDAALAEVSKPTSEFVTMTEGYGRDQQTGERLLVDIYLPAGSVQEAPMLLYFHGGGWILHDRTLQGRTLRALAETGLVVLAFDYALATQHRATWESAADQSACALAWAAVSAERFGADSSRIVLAGDSAGGGLALAAAYRAAAGGKTPECGARDVESGAPLPVPAGAVGVVPVVDVAGFHSNPEPNLGHYARTMVERYLGGTPAEHPDRVAAVSPLTHLTTSAPPTLLVTVEHDHLVPSEGARMLTSAATALDVPVTVVDVPFADHGLLARADGLGARVAREAIVTFIEGLAPTR